MARVTDSEIKGTIESFVNSIYDNGEESSWVTASEAQWVYAVYSELANTKRMEFGSFVQYYESPVNRFDGKDYLIDRIIPLLEIRLNRLAKELPYFTFKADTKRIVL